jgi:hypothetical protein
VFLTEEIEIIFECTVSARLNYNPSFQLSR